MALVRTVTLLPGVENRRAGRVLGDDGAERIVRTFHARFASIKCGGTTTARQAAEYVLREGKHAGEEDENKADVEAAAGDKEAMLADARRIRQTARITHGPTGERILATQIIELPAESTPEQRQACAQAFVDDWRERGHQAIAVVHMHGHDKDRPQPHLHVLATGRPVAADGTVDRSAPLWRNRDEVKAERARTARLVNEHCHTVAAFHPGGFKDIGRAEDTPKWRTPTGVYLKVVAASTEGAGWEEKDAAARAQYAAARRSAELAEPKRTRKKEIAAARERGEKPPRVRPTLRQRLARAEAGRSELAADLDRLAAERARQAAGKQQAEARVDRAEGRVRELQELNAVQTKYVTDWHGDRGAEPPDLATVEGLSLAWANMRAWEIEARKRRKDEAAAKKDEHEKALADEQKKTQEKIAEAVQRALETERERQEAEPDPAPPVPADLPVHEAQPDLPATWTLPLGELMKAGGAVAQAAMKKWGKGDASPVSMPLDGLADSPVLTFTPERGLFRKQPASWRYEDTGRYAGEAAIELAQPGFTDRNLDWPNWAAAAEALSRVLVTAALEDGAEPPGWLQNTFQDLDEEYGPEIRTKEYYGEHARTYVGEMSGGEPHGAGTMTWKSARRFQGRFENGQRHGQGVMTTSDGGRYEGEWQKSTRHGQGEYDYPDGRRYEGAFENNAPHGQGIQTWSDGTRYQGQFENGAFPGEGVMTWADGRRYEGAFENGLRHGQGEYDYPDGRGYEGAWQKGKRHGPGIGITAEGQRTEGVWEDGQRVEAAAKEQQAAPRKTPTRSSSRDDDYDLD